MRTATYSWNVAGWSLALYLMWMTLAALAACLPPPVYEAQVICPYIIQRHGVKIPEGTYVVVQDLCSESKAETTLYANKLYR